MGKSHVWHSAHQLRDPVQHARTAKLDPPALCPHCPAGSDDRNKRAAAQGNVAPEFCARKIIGALLLAGFFTFPFDRLLGRWLFG